MANNFLIGGKLGDFLHGMYVVKNLSVKQNIKAKIHMIDIGWEHGIETTFKEITPILLQQEFVESVAILENYEMDLTQNPVQNSPIKVFDTDIIQEGYVDMSDYLRAPLLYKACWSELLSDQFKFDIPKNNQWMTYDTIDLQYQNKIVIHRRYNPARLNDEFPYEQILEEHGNNAIFVSTSEYDYDHFPLKQKLPFVRANTLEELFTIVNSCAMTVSNLTGFTVISHALNKLRIIELPNTADAMHCIGEEKYSDKVFWFLNTHTHNLS